MHCPGNRVSLLLLGPPGICYCDGWLFGEAVFCLDGRGPSAPGFAFGLQGEGRQAWPGQIGVPPQQEAWLTSPAGGWPPAGMPPGFATRP